MKENENHEIALWLLSHRMRKVFIYPMLHPQDIFNACVNYVSSNGCKSRAEFESIVIYLMSNDQYTKKILLEV